jgi:biofilm PGA synthesis N-glycosyltransferase PgaC
VAYRRRALVECGGWNPRTSTEDIDLSWRFQSSGWKIRYEMDWTARVMMACSWRSLWMQRRRWSSGLGRTIREQWAGIFGHTSRHVPVAFVTLLCALWMWMCAVALVLAVIGAAVPSGFGKLIDIATSSVWTHWSLYAQVFGVQLLVAILIDRGAWKRYPVLLLMAPFYPIYFWCILLTSYFAGFPQGFFRRDGGKWTPSAFAAGAVDA